MRTWFILKKLNKVLACLLIFSWSSIGLSTIICFLFKSRSLDWSSRLLNLTISCFQFVTKSIRTKSLLSRFGPRIIISRCWEISLNNFRNVVMITKIVGSTSKSGLVLFIDFSVVLHCWVWILIYWIELRRISKIGGHAGDIVEFLQHIRTRTSKRLFSKPLFMVKMVIYCLGRTIAWRIGGHLDEIWVWLTSFCGVLKDLYLLL